MRTRRRLLPVVAGALLVVIGIVVAATTPREVSFGWFAYAPLSETMFSPGTMVVTPGLATAAALIVLGLLVLAFCAGWLLARRRLRTASGASRQGS
ncbi:MULTISPECIES: hypothetical protein [unclassified Rathayibacter]|uniref:hypothetical protein n=1 Tax=unclassified Rathayibacter TaxID=2609250 RepID=UPI000FB787E9|nr:MULTISPECIES: hypothetical protein [unclassified Rathayibacter]MCJ1702739.1 hypothetical protein [Rathayibacter sp. VKM Ac-2926]ROP48663.1 hypothetical protein EDF45_2780 [Rathayibacter sp. PhB186]ROS49812.1 hypothetical protein EDF44_2782 [Rathayibacter sp. PhB185]